MNSVIAIVGPTAIGKTALAICLCKEFNGEIVSADSRQVYRYMDVGTAKPSHEEQEQIRHHLINVVNPDETFSLALYQSRARLAVEDIGRRNKQAFLVGGSGLYVWALLEGWRIPAISPDMLLRQELEVRAKTEGDHVLYQELADIDPIAAQNIEPRNMRRVIRALEVCKQGSKFSDLQIKEPFFDYTVIGLTTSKDQLYDRIDRRVDWMMENGLLNEVQNLCDMGYGFHLPSMSGIGYRHMGMYFRGECDLNSAVQKMKIDTHRFTRRQYNWFSVENKNICWFTIGEGLEETVSDHVYNIVRN